MTRTNIFRRRSIVFLLSIVFFFIADARAAGGAAPQTGAADLGELEKVVLDELRETKTPGAAVAIVNGGRVVYAKGFGVRDVETNTPVTPDTLFRLGSTTKMFTGAAAVVLAEQGKIKLDAPVGDYAKGLPPKLSRVTAHQLLSNAAGVADFSPPSVSHDDAALAAMVRGWKDDALFGEPGKVYSYSSPGFWLTGYVIEEAGGKPYADMMEELLFKPLGMARTTFRPHMAMTYPLALGHNTQDGKAAIIRPAFNNVAMWPAGSIFSSANDLARFVVALLGGGRLEDKQVLPASLFTKLSGEHVSMPGEPSVHYGYGLLSFKDRGARLVMHGGFSRGYGSMIQMVPERGFAVIVVANRSGETLRRTTEKAKELFLKLEPQPAQPRQAQPLAEGDAAKFVGRYVNGPQTWEVLGEGGAALFEGRGRRVRAEEDGRPAALLRRRARSGRGLRPRRRRQGRVHLHGPVRGAKELIRNDECGMMNDESKTS